jgi:hypothetical protein
MTDARDLEQRVLDTWDFSDPSATAEAFRAAADAADHARPSAGRHQQRHSRNTYDQPRKPVLRRPLEPKRITTMCTHQPDGTLGAHEGASGSVWQLSAAVS